MLLKSETLNDATSLVSIRDRSLRPSIPPSSSVPLSTRHAVNLKRSTFNESWRKSARKLSSQATKDSRIGRSRSICRALRGISRSKPSTGSELKPYRFVQYRLRNRGRAQSLALLFFTNPTKKCLLTFECVFYITTRALCILCNELRTQCRIFPTISFLWTSISVQSPLVRFVRLFKKWIIKRTYVNPLETPGKRT